MKRLDPLWRLDLLWKCVCVEGRVVNTAAVDHLCGRDISHVTEAVTLCVVCACVCVCGLSLCVCLSLSLSLSVSVCWCPSPFSEPGRSGVAVGSCCLSSGTCPGFFQWRSQVFHRDLEQGCVCADVLCACVCVCVCVCVCACVG